LTERFHAFWFFLLLAMVVLANPAFGEQPSPIATDATVTVVVLQLQQNVLIPFEQSRIFFSDFFEVLLPDPTLQKEFYPLIFGYAPLAGRVLTLDSDYVRSRLQAMLSTAFQVEPVDFEQIQVERGQSTSSKRTDSSSTGPVSANPPEGDSVQTLAFLREAFLEQYLPASLRESTPSTSILFECLDALPVSELLWPKQTTVSFSPFSPGVFLVQLRAPEIKGNWMGKVRPQWLRKVALAQRNIQYKDVVGSDSIRFEERNYFENLGAYTPETFPDGFVARRYLPAGTVLTDSMLEPPPYVRKGQTIVAMISLGGVRVSTFVTLLADAKLGDIVSARNNDTGILVRGRIDPGPILTILGE